MKNVKRLVVALLCIATLVSCLALTSCFGMFCSHEWGEWENEVAAGCAKAGADVRKCQKCGHTETRTIDATGHSFGEWTRVEGTTCEIGAMERVCATCNERETKKEGNSHVGGILCDYCGEKIVSLDKIFDLTPLESINNCAVVVNNFTFGADDGLVEVDAAEIVLYLNDEGMLEGYGYGELLVKNTAVDVEHTTKAALYVEGAKVYAAVDGYGDIDTTNEMDFWVELDLYEALMGSEQVAQAIGMLEYVESKLPEIEAWLNDTFLPIFENVEIAIEIDEDKISSALYAFADALFASAVTEDGTVLSLSADALKAANAKLATTEIDALIDSIVGEGTYNAFKEAVPSALEFSVGRLLVEVDKAGINIDAVFTALDELAVILTGDETATLESALDLGDVDISELVKQDDVKKLSVRDALISAFGFEDNAETEENEAEESLDAAIDALFEAAETKTLYEITGADDAAKAQEAIDEAIDNMFEYISFTILLNKDGVMENITIGYADEYADVALEIKLDETGINVKLSGNDDSVDVDVSIVANYVTELKKENVAITLESIKEALDVDVITEENYASIYVTGSNVTVEPHYVDGVFAGIKVTEKNSWGGSSSDLLGNYSEDYKITEYIVLAEDVPYLKLVGSEGCGTKRIVRIMVCAEATVSYVTEYYSADGLISSETTDSYTTMEHASLDIEFDASTGEIVDSAGHYWVLDAENSTYGKCEEYDVEIYTCECGDTKIDYYYNDHDFDDKSTTASSIVANCSEEGCDECITLTLNFDSVLTLTHAPEKAEATWYDTCYSFTVSESGTYKFAWVRDEWYIDINVQNESGYGVGVSYSEYNGSNESYTYELVAGETYYFCLYANASYDSADEVLNVTITKE